MINLLDRFATPLDIDAFATAVNPRWGTRLRGVIERIDAVGEHAATITIRTTTRWSGHTPGQFVTIGVDVNGVRHHRCYSLTSLPSVGRSALIEITVQATSTGVVSDHLVHHARRGEIVQLAAAEGEFVLSDPLPARLLFITGGSGITPVLSMLRVLAGRPHRSEVVVVHHAATPERCLFRDELAELAARSPWLRVEMTYTRGGGGAHLDAARLESAAPDWRDAQTYVCGPRELIEFAATHWRQADLGAQLHIERFCTSPLVAVDPNGAVAGEGGRATFATSAVTAQAAATTPLLEVAEAAGLTPAYGCRMGICRTCSTHLDAGCVRDLRDGRLIESGEHIQLCVCAAATDVVLSL